MICSRRVVIGVLLLGLACGGTPPDVVWYRSTGLGPQLEVRRADAHECDPRRPWVEMTWDGREISLYGDEALRLPPHDPTVYGDAPVYWLADNAHPGDFPTVIYLDPEQFVAADLAPLGSAIETAAPTMRRHLAADPNGPQLFRVVLLVIGRHDDFVETFDRREAGQVRVDPDGSVTLVRGPSTKWVGNIVDGRLVMMAGVAEHRDEAGRTLVERFPPAR